MGGRYCQIFLLALFAPMPALAGPQTLGDLRVEEVEFVSHGAKLSGSLVLPRDGQIRAAVVFIHGSGKQTRNMTWAGRFASEGIAALVYDKRGVGKSGGEYEGEQSVSEKNIALLADDSVSALSAGEHPSLKGTAWDSRASARPAGSPPWPRQEPPREIPGSVERPGLQGERGRHLQQIHRRCGGPDRAVVSAGARFEDREIRLARFPGKDTDSREDLDRLSMPGLWIFSDNDSSIPVDLSIARLQALRKSGHRYDYVLFSGLGHNNMDGTFASPRIGSNDCRSDREPPGARFCELSRHAPQTSTARPVDCQQL